MSGMPFTALGKGGGSSFEQLQVQHLHLHLQQQATPSDSSAWFNKNDKGGVILIDGSEPRSVLDHRRSPSPSPPNSSASPSALSLSPGDVAAVSDTTTTTTTNSSATNRWPTTAETSAGAGGIQKREDTRASPDLPPIPAGLEMGFAGSIEKCGGIGPEEWDNMLSASPASAAASSPGLQEQTFLRWIMGDVDDQGSLKLQNQAAPHQQFLFPGPAELDAGNSTNAAGFSPFGLLDPPTFTMESPGFPPPLSSDSGSSNRIPSLLFPLDQPLSLPQGLFFQEDSKPIPPPLFSPPALGLLHHHQQNPSPNPAFFLPLPTPFEQHQVPPSANLFPHPAKRHNSIPSDPGGAPPDLFLFRNQLPPPSPGMFPPLHPSPVPRMTKPKTPTASEPNPAAAQHQQLLDGLFEAARLAESGNSVGARGILARLNQQLPAPASGKPLLRSAFYFKEALLLALTNPSASPSHCLPSPTTPFDVVLKLGAYKAFSDSSPIVQFANFTCTQALLEELGGSACIHIVDFDIGVGGQWASFMQELAQRRCCPGPTGSTVAMLKVTAFVTPTAHHPLELHLTRENLSQFAAELGIPFEFNLLSLDSFVPAELLSFGGHGEAVAVNLPVGSTHGPSLPTLLRLVKQLGPKIVVSVDHGFDRSGPDLSFSQHFLHAFQSCMSLLDSIDSTGTSLDLANKIERFIVQPRVESTVLSWYRSVGERVVPWRALFASVGFVLVPFSNFTETQAECILKRVQVRGFHVEKRQGSLVLYWQRGELVSVSAWRC